MGGFGFTIAIALGSTVFTVGGAYLAFRKGLAFRMFSLVMPLLAFTAILARVMPEQERGSPAYVGLAILATVVSVGTLVHLYRSTVSPLLASSLSLQSNSAQLAATAAQSAATAAEQSTMATQIGVTMEEIAQTSASASESAIAARANATRV